MPGSFYKTAAYAKSDVAIRNFAGTNPPGEQGTEQARVSYNSLTSILTFNTDLAKNRMKIFVKEVSMPRTEMTDKEVEIHKNAIEASIRKDFLKSDVSYQDSSEIQCLAGYKRNTDEAKRLVRTKLKDEFGAAIVAVGDSKVAIVKRPKEG